MTHTVEVNSRGQITLPSSLRKRLGLTRGGVVTISERNGEFVLERAIVVPVEMYTDAQINAWTKEDGPKEQERAEIRERVRSSQGRKGAP